MANFNLDRFQILVVDQARIDGQYFPVPEPDWIAEELTLLIYENGRPYDLGVGTGNRLVERWSGPKVIDVYAGFDSLTNQQLTQAEALAYLVDGLPIDFRKIGTKRGGDFRTRFWPEIKRRLGVSQAIPDPISLGDGDLDSAVVTLVGRTSRNSTRLSRSTIDNIDVAYDGKVHNAGGKDDTAINLETRATSGGGEYYRSFLRTSLSIIPSGNKVIDSILQGNIIQRNAGGDGNEVIEISAYNSTGATDPQPDSGGDAYTRSGTTALASFGNSQIITTGSKSVDLGSTFDALIEGLIASPGFVAFGLRINKETGTWTSYEEVVWESIENTGTDPFTLTVEHITTLISVTGTVIQGLLEEEVVAGGETIILTLLTADSWQASGTPFNDIRQDIINGLNSNKSETNGWNAEVRAKLGVSAVVRTSDTIVTITLTAAAAYNISLSEIITVTVPASALVTSNDPIVASPTFLIAVDLAPIELRNPGAAGNILLSTPPPAGGNVPEKQMSYRQRRVMSK
jgi:hypothetical protein